MSKDTQTDLEHAFEEMEDALQAQLEGEMENALNELEEEIGNPINEPIKNEVVENKKPVVRLSQFQKDLEMLYAEFEKLKTEAKEKQDRAKDLKEEIINIMDTMGKDEVIINGLDSIVQLSITYPEREVLNKKELAEALNIKQKELSKPQTIIELTKEGKITTDMIEKYTVLEERMQFSAKEYDPNGEDD